jgi:hypothetical protein
VFTYVNAGHLKIKINCMSTASITVYTDKYTKHILHSSFTKCFSLVWNKTYVGFCVDAGLDDDDDDDDCCVFLALLVLLPPTEELLPPPPKTRFRR